MGDDKYSVRVTIKRVSPTEYTFKLEMSKNGGEFSVVQEMTGRKATAPAAAAKP
jgi:ABC-type transporter MlaC component